MPSPRLRGLPTPGRLRPAIVAALAALLMIPAAASADVTVTTTPGESFTSSATYIRAVADGAAEGGKTLAMYTAGTAQATVTPSSPTSSIAVLLRGTECDGAPTLQVTVDGVKTVTFTVAATKYSNYTVAKSLSAGSHTIALALTNDHSSASCDRNVYVDTVRTLSPSVSGPVTAVAVSSKLRWPAPALTAPTTIAVAQGDQTYTLDKTKDYVLNLGTTTHQGNVTISGGRNVVMKGGAIALPATSTKSTALNIVGSVGIVQVEGVLFNGATHEMDAIQINAPAAIVQVENVRAVGLLGSFDTNHTDVIQPWGGVKDLRVDHLTADSNYQGIYTRPDQGGIGSVELQNVDLTFNAADATSSGGYLLWMTNGCAMAPTTLSNLYLTPRLGTSLGSAVWPATNDASCPSKLTGNTVSFPKLPVTGGVIGGAPPAGAFVPAGKAGTAYASPGYQ
ncbi:carbohydrate-binding domain-containing protein [Baekduia sp.]|jgi:hypothetical protein|uniref:carbohydrate-binding domain-containing protein n=1 Tax=Baekduia sp. TaxID=2600305 RepID=UPI002DFCBF7C|nr:carbohydrate-binding domain-containing protein [Baekduia sp.]